MNISWGIKIAVLYIGFVVLIGVLVFKSMNQKVDLVSPDYYEKELKFQDKINAQNNANALTQPIQYQVEGKSISLFFPETMVNNSFGGEVLFFRPSDSAKDIKVQLAPDAKNKQLIISSLFEHGEYKMQLSWHSGGKEYYKEETIFIQ